MRYEYFEVIKSTKNMPFKRNSFIKGYKLSNSYVLGGYKIGEVRKENLLKSGAIRKISKAELTRILFGRNVY